KLKDQSGLEYTLKEYTEQKKKVLIYFYPKDDTPGCTTEACSFRDNLKDLAKMGLVVIGISKDSVKSHDKFAKKYDLNFPILSDEEGKVIESYDAWGNKKFMGREYMGILRKSFLINEEGKIEKIYEEVKPAEHVKEVKSDII
ncbi:MAG: thioredoxin-dependent thiol peroxidase, partial [Candidatus Pacebacteria bacterium]|nr:thioredoxin-dependent thiol peroxidase [Candidatus Paceibacterota bacterium]